MIEGHEKFTIMKYMFLGFFWVVIYVEFIEVELGMVWTVFPEGILQIYLLKVEFCIPISPLIQCARHNIAPVANELSRFLIFFRV